MKVIFDTNAYTRLTRGYAPVIELLESAEEILASTVVLGELLAGFKSGSRRKENISILRDFLDQEVTAVLDVTEDVSDRYADLFANLRSQGTPLPTNDIWIAATCLEAGARLITYDAHFDKIPGLVVLAP